MADEFSELPATEMGYRLYDDHDAGPGALAPVRYGTGEKKEDTSIKHNTSSNGANHPSSSSRSEQPTGSPVARFFRWVSGWMLPGLGMFTNAYTMLAVGNIGPILKAEDPECWDGEGAGTECPDLLRDSVRFSVFLGVVLGMVGGGILGDVVGRRRGLIGTSIIMLIGSLLIVSSYGPDLEFQYSWYVTALGIFGIGVGGEYPLAAVASAEKAEEARLEAEQKMRVDTGGGDQDDLGNGQRRQQQHRGRSVSLSFSMQGFGNWANTVIILVLMLCFFGVDHPPGQAYDKADLETVWRVQYLLGSLVLIGLVYYRVKYVEESKVWLAQKEANRAAQGNNASVGEMELAGEDGGTGKPSSAGHILTTSERMKLFFSVYWCRMIGTAGGWCVWDLAFYGNKVFQTQFIKIFHPDAGIVKILEFTLINNTVAYIGYFVAAATLDKPWMGRRRMQMMGFAMMFILFLSGGIFWNHLQQDEYREIMQILYYLTTFFGQWGPNATTWIFPSEVYPAEMRAVGHGLSGAGGKLGALFASVTFSLIDNKARFFLCACCGLIGLVLTFFWLPEVMDVPLSENDAFWAGKKRQLRKRLLNGAAAADDSEPRYEDGLVDQSPFYEHLSLAERLCGLKHYRPPTM